MGPELRKLSSCFIKFDLRLSHSRGKTHCGYGNSGNLVTEFKQLLESTGRPDVQHPHPLVGGNWSPNDHGLIELTAFTLKVWK